MTLKDSPNYILYGMTLTTKDMFSLFYENQVAVSMSMATMEVIEQVYRKQGALSAVFPFGKGFLKLMSDKPFEPPSPRRAQRKSLNFAFFAFFAVDFG